MDERKYYPARYDWRTMEEENIGGVYLLNILGYFPVNSMKNKWKYGLFRGDEQCSYEKCNK